MSAILDDRKRLVFRPFEQISARFGGNVSVLQATQSSPALPMSAEFSIVFTRERAFMALPLLRSPYFQASPPQMATRARLTLVTTRCQFDVAFRVWWGCIWPLKHACN